MKFPKKLGPSSLKAGLCSIRLVSVIFISITDCNVPLMASKNKENKICCSCDKNFMKPSPKIAEVKVPKVERKEQKIPIPQK